MHAGTGTHRVVAGRYVLAERIGRGAMGTVWRARDPVLARDVAIKEVQPRHLLTDGERTVLRERTMREARAAARLNHPGVVTVFDVVEANGTPWIVMELVLARSLEQALAKDGPLPPWRVAQIGTMLLGALACAHAAGIMHRDVKPSNVLLSKDGRAVLTDFGIATYEGDPGLTQAGMVMGTPGFCAPERIRGAPATPASDLWSLGATLFAAVEGHSPFAGRTTPMAILAAVANEDPPPTRSAGPLSPVIDALLRRDPGQRPDAAAAGRMLAAGATPYALDGERPGPGRRGEPTEPARPAQRPEPPQISGPVPLPELAKLLEPPPKAAEPPARPAPGHGLGRPVPGRQQATRSGPSGGPGRHASGTVKTGLQVPALPIGPGSQRRMTAAGGPGPLRLLSRHPLLVAVAVAAALAALLTGLLLSRSASARAGAAAREGVSASASQVLALPAGYRWLTVPGVTAGSAEGLRLAVPRGWHASHRGWDTSVTAPAGTASLSVSLAPLAVAGTQLQARVLERTDTGLGALTGYHRIAFRSYTFDGAPAARWEFSWRRPGIGRVIVLDVVFSVPAPAGRQSFSLRASAPAANWQGTQAVFREAFSTFQPLG